MRSLTALLLAPLALGATLVAATPAIAGSHAGTSESEISAKPEMKDIVGIATSKDKFSTLTTALSEAELVEVLAGEGPFTVFAPTNDAFDALEAANPGILATLLDPANRETLVEILTYHVVAGDVMSTDLTDSEVPTVQGSDVEITVGEGVTVNGANVIMADVEASNGVIHVIDAVILPPDLEL